MLDRLSAWAATDGRFWAIVFVAAALRSAMSDRLGWRATLTTFAAAFFSAWVFTDPLMHFLALEETYRELAAVAIALTGEGVMRFAILASSDTDFVKDILSRRFGGGK